MLEKIKFSHSYSLKEQIPITVRKKVLGLLRKWFQVTNHSVIETEVEVPKESKLVFIFSVIKYSFRDQRPQKIARHLAKAGYTVFYVEHEFLITRNLNKPPFAVKPILKNVYSLTLSSKNDYFIYTDEVLTTDKKVITNSLLNFLASFNLLNNDKTLIFNHPFWGNFDFTIIGKTRGVYDCFDDHSSFGLVSRNQDDCEEKLFRDNLTIVTSDFLRKKAISSKAKSVTVINNGVDFDFFHNRIDVQKTKQNTIGYVGAIEEWIDEEIIEKLLQSFSNYKIVLAGKVNNNKISRMSSRYKNLILLGEVKKEYIPSLINSFAVCIIPFKVNNLIRATDPIKFYEYLSIGKPVVTTDIPELKKFADICYPCRGADEFARGVRVALNERNNQHLLTKRFKVAKSRDWAVLLRDFENKMKGG